MAVVVVCVTLPSDVQLPLPELFENRPCTTKPTLKVVTVLPETLNEIGLPCAVVPVQFPL
jgi:hypothetical protein